MAVVMFNILVLSLFSWVVVILAAAVAWHSVTWWCGLVGQLALGVSRL
jgi:hypothetical protein